MRTKLYAFLLGCFPFVSALGAPALVQHASNASYSASFTVALSGVAADDTLMVIPCGYTTPSTPTDSNGTVSTAFGYASGGTDGAGVGIYYVNAAAAGTHTFTVNFGTAGNGNAVIAAEFSGLAATPFDKASTLNYGSGSSASSGSITPASNGELLLGAVMGVGSDITFSSWTNGFTLGGSNLTDTGCAFAYYVQSAAASIDVGVTLSPTTQWVSGLAAFTSSGGASGGAPSQPSPFAVGASLWGRPVSLEAMAGLPVH